MLIIAQAIMPKLPTAEQLKAFKQRFPWLRYGQHDGKLRLGPHIDLFVYVFLSMCSYFVLTYVSYFHFSYNKSKQEQSK